VVGWPLLWAIPLAPLRLFGEPSVHAAWGVGVALSLLFVAVATVACGLLGREATGSDRVGIGAATLFTCWPLLTALLGGEQAWENGTWLVDAGLHLYTEPLSTALVTAALVLVVRRASREAEHAAAGLLLGFSTVVKLTNGVIALALLPLVGWRRGPRAAAVYAAGAALWAPLVAVYWNKGYIANYGGSISASDHPWGLRYAADNWTGSLLFTPTVLAILAPLAIAGLLGVRERWPRLVLLAPLVVTAAVYTVYHVTALHPRFLFVALPCLFVLEAAGAAALAVRVRGART
jgi:hypothetical protein